MWGWEPAEVTTYEYDDAGRMIRSVTVRESEFNTQDRVSLLGLKAFEAGLNPHGIPIDVATDPANQFGFVADENPTTDWAEKTLGDARDAYYKKWAEGSRHGQMWGVRKRPSVPVVEEVLVSAEEGDDHSD